MKKHTKEIITQSLRWSLFIMAAMTMSLKIAEAAAYNTLILIVKNPELAQYTDLVNYGYLIIR